MPNTRAQVIANVIKPLLIVGLVGLFSVVSGCGESEPFRLTSVRGTVKYADGSLVVADQIRVTFVPQDVAASGKMVGRAAVANVNTADGTFEHATTHKPNDGAIVARHKVIVQALMIDPRTGFSVPSKAIATEFTSADRTPLEVDVTIDGENKFELVVNRRKAG